MLPSTARLGVVTLAVSSLDGVRRFYQQDLGLRVFEESAQILLLGDQEPLVRLVAHPNMSRDDVREAGLYHLAFVVGSPARLARMLVAVVQNQSGVYQGASDHGVSKAFYLTDPEGNGVELYIDMPREAWKYDDGALQMTSLPLDPNAFIQEHWDESAAGAIRMGHIHLRVGDIAAAKAFYMGELGFELTAELGDSAAFFAAGGYHHHIGVNTWHSKGAGQRTARRGIESFEIQVPGLPTQRELRDPWGTRVILVASPRD